MSRAYTRTSPSQINGFMLCARRWFYGSVEYLPQPQSPEAEEGEGMHRELEKFALDGVMPTDPSCKKATLWMPPPQTPGVIIETKTVGLSLKTNAGAVAVNGRVDLVDARDERHPRILDWKTKSASGFKRLRKTLPVANDPQLILYAAWAFVKWPDAEYVTVGHGYLVRGKDEATADFKPLMAPAMTREVVDSYVAPLIPTVEQMVVAASAMSAEDLEPNHEACWAFGQRCPFYDRCRPAVTGFAEMFNDGAEVDMGLIDKLRASAGAASIPDPSEFVGVATATSAPQAGATDVVPPAPVSADPPAPVAVDEDILSRLKALVSQ